MKKILLLLGACCCLGNFAFAQLSKAELEARLDQCNIVYDRALRDKYDLIRENENLLRTNDSLRQVIQRLQNGQTAAAPSRNPSSTGTNTRLSAAELEQQVEAAKRKVNTRLKTETAKHWGGTITAFRNQFHYVVVDLNSTSISTQLYWKDSADNYRYGSIGELKTRLQQRGQNLIFATNGGMFNPDFAPQGLLIENGLVKQGLDIEKGGFGNFYMQPNGVFLIDAYGGRVLTTQSFQRLYPRASGIHYATQSGPMLVIDGRMNPLFTKDSPNKLRRSGVGVIDESRVVFILSKYQVNFYDFTRIFKDIFPCSNALFLDGQVSRMYYPTIGKNEALDLGGNFGTIIGITERK